MKEIYGIKTTCPEFCEKGKDDRIKVLKKQLSVVESSLDSSRLFNDSLRDEILFLRMQVDETMIENYDIKQELKKYQQVVGEYYTDHEDIQEDIWP